MLRIALLIVIQLFVALLAGAQSASTGEPCPSESNLAPSQQLGVLAETAQNAACVQTYQQKRCEEFKKSLAPEDQSKVISCDERDSLSVGKVLLSCGAGAVDFVVDTVTGVVHLVSQLPHLPGAVLRELQKTGEFIQKCNEDPQLRASLFEPVAPLYSEDEKRILLQELPCEGLIQTVQLQTQNGLNGIQEKKRLQEHFSRRYPEREMPAHIKLTPGEETFLQKYGEAADVEKARLNRAFTEIWNQVQSRLACYNTAARIEVTCAIVADLAASAVTGGAVAAVSRTAHVQRTAQSIAERLSPTEMMEIRRAMADHKPQAVVGGGSTTRVRDSDRTIPYDSAKTVPYNPDRTVVHMDQGALQREAPFWGNAATTDPVERRRRVSGRATPESVSKLAGEKGLAPSQLSYSPLPKLPGRTELAPESSLRTSAVKTKKALDSQGVNEAFVVTLEDGTRGVWKPHQEKWSSNYRAEVLAYELDQKLGFDLVPPTVVRSIDGEVGSLQLFRESVQGAAPRSHDLNRQSLFDYLIDNKDRHDNNFLVTGKGEVISIDNGLSFTGFGYNGASFATREKGIAAFLKTRDGRNIVTNIRRFVADPQSKKSLVEYLGKEDAERVILRMNMLLKYDERRQ